MTLFAGDSPDHLRGVDSWQSCLSQNPVPPLDRGINIQALTWPAEQVPPPSGPEADRLRQRVAPGGRVTEQQVVALVVAAQPPLQRQRADRGRGGRSLRAD